MKKKLKIFLIVIGIFILCFIIDLICIFTINRPLFAVREDNGDSVNIIYKGLLYDTYNCHENSSMQIVLKWKKYSCDNSVKEVNVYATSEVENVSATISDISLTGATITIKDTNLTKYTYGEWYVIQKEENGKWYNIPTKVKEYGFNSIGYEVDENNEVKFVIDWKWLYGELSQGSYRIIKESHGKYISIPFNIAETQSSKKESIKPNLFDRSEIIKVAIDNYSQYKNNFEYTDKDTIDKVYNLFKNLETDVASKSDEPENSDELYKVTFFNDENMLIESDNDIFKAIVYVYKKDSKYYAEERKNGIYEITEDAFNIIKNLTK